MKITFLGAAHEVTGSQTLLEAGGRNYLIDCGMEQGADVFENAPLPVAPADIDAVFLTHAHIDHSGMLPKLVKDGFAGKIYTTRITEDLCRIMLLDAAHIQESETEWQNRKARRAGEPEIEPLYTAADAAATMRYFIGLEYGRIYPVSENIDVRFTDIGHLLGSACIEIWMREKGVEKKMVFSGDIGDLRQPILRDPQQVADADYLLIESTYGNREHEAAGDTLKEFADILRRTLRRGGNVVIPSFAVGRTQEMLYALREIRESGMVKDLGNFPVYIDSPLASESTQIFLQTDPEYFDDETRALLEKGINPIWFSGIELSATAEESKAINFDTRPKVILSASGMCEAGRIRHHLKHNLWDPKNTILFVGYQAAHTLGRRLLEGVKNVTLFGEEIAVCAEIRELHGTSGHADRSGLLHWLDGFRVKPSLVFVGHGDDASCTAFRDTLVYEKGMNAVAPYSGTVYNLATGAPVFTAPPRYIRKGQNAVYEKLLAAAARLQKSASRLKGHSNKELLARIKDIEEIIEKMKN